MTAKDASDYIGCHKEIIYRLTSGGEIPHWKIGRNIRFSKKSIDKWISKQETLSVSREIKA